LTRRTSRGSKAAAHAFVTSVKNLRGEYAKARNAAATLPTGDPAAFATAAQAPATQLKTANSTLATTLATTGKPG
jgi:phytoene/squalene synthetase